MPTLQSKLTKQYDEQLARQEAAKLAREKLEKKRQKNAAKRLAREVCFKCFQNFSEPLTFSYDILHGSCIGSFIS